AGVSTAGITVNGSSADAGLRCTLPQIDPGSSATVVVQLTIAPDAQDGAAVIAVDDSQAQIQLSILRRELLTHSRPIN
ncbi:MAG: hypothetical protein ABJD68_09820, partial [Nakamurella sp.]